MKIDKKKKLIKVKNIGEFKEKVLLEFPCESKSLYMDGYTLFIISTNISGIINTILGKKTNALCTQHTWTSLKCSDL